MTVFAFRQNFASSKAAAKKSAASEVAKRKEVVAKLRREGDAFFKAGQLIEPVGANAQVRFEQILEIDPNDTYARRRIDEIKQRAVSLREQSRRIARRQKQVQKLLEDGERFFEKGDLVSPPGANAKESYEAVLRLDSDNEQAQAKLKEIKTVFSEMLGEINTLIARAKQYRSKGQIISPPGKNAYEMLKEVMRQDPGNREATDLLLNMAAETIYQGDAAKKRAEVATMKRSYLIAQALGVDPAYLAPRLRGVALMKKSRSNVIIFDGSKSDAKQNSSDGNYLNTEEIERRIAAFKLEAEIGGASSDDQKFYELQ